MRQEQNGRVDGIGGIVCVCDIGELWLTSNRFNDQQLISDEKWYSHLRWLKDGSKADANIANEGRGAKGQVEGIVFKVGRKY